MVYAVVLFKQPDDTKKQTIRNRIKKRPYFYHYPVYFVKYNGTLEGLSDEIGFNEEKQALGVIFSVGNYTGYGPAELWEWIREQSHV